jgi:hypothetical protein
MKTFYKKALLLVLALSFLTTPVQAGWWQDPTTSTGAAVDTTLKAGHVTARPPEAVGAYRISVTTGTLAAALAANAQVFQFKWTDATKLAVIQSVRTRFQPLTPFTAATLTDHTSFDAVIVRSYSGGGGGTTLTLTGNNAKMRTSMATSLATINVAQTAALTAATTLDAHPFCQSIRKGNRVNPAAATEETIQPTTDGLNCSWSAADGDYPLILAQNEGFVIRNRTVWPAAGTGIVLVEVHWLEVPAY